MPTDVAADASFRMRHPLICVTAAVAASLVASARAGSACDVLLQDHDALLRRAHQAEVLLVQAQRRQLCPRLERLAAQPQTTAEPQASVQSLDYGAYSQCRQHAERALAQQRPALYRNAQGLPYYTPDGAQLARQAAALELTRPLQCRDVSSGATRPPQTP